MSTTEQQLAALRASTADLLAGIEAEQWSDTDMRAPSLLPNWTRGHVLTHIARNADGITATLAGALRGEIVLRYPDGPAGRAADIEDGAGRSAVELVDDVRESTARIDRLFGAVADADGWDLPSDTRPARAWVKARWKEVEVDPDGSTTTDLGGTVWTAGSGDPVVVRGPDWALLAWLVGRPMLAAGAVTAT